MTRSLVSPSLASLASEGFENRRIAVLTRSLALVSHLGTERAAVRYAKAHYRGGAVTPRRGLYPLHATGAVRGLRGKRAKVAKNAATNGS